VRRSGCRFATIAVARLRVFYRVCCERRLASGPETLQGAMCCTERLYNAAHWAMEMLRETKNPAICGAS
jgi:hypothetical protein